MSGKRVTAGALALAICFGASSLLAQQQQASGVTRDTTPAEVIARGTLAGQSSAQSVGTGGWMAGGVVTGALTGLIGTAVIWAVAGSSDVTVPTERRIQIANESAPYQLAFEGGYGQKLKSRRKSAALGGGLIGTAAFVLVYIAATSGQ